MSENRLYAHVLLDRSGSMEACRDTTISAFNNYVRSLQVHEATLTRLSLTQFDTHGIDLVHDKQSVHIVPALTREAFQPRGGTPLYDSIARTVAHMDAVDLVGDEAVCLVILTDGQENASREHTRESIKALLEARQSERNWLVLYLGANQDAFAESRKIGIAADHSLEFRCFLSEAAFAAAADNTVEFSRSRVRSKAVFSEKQRRRAKGEA